MRWYVADYNGILTDLKTKLSGHLATPRDADVWVTWQDAQGSYKDLLQSAAQLGIRPPTFTVQHGRGSTLDYGKPNEFPLLCDKYLCWGSADYNRLASLGYRDRAKIVGCPLNTKIKAKIPHKERVILFVPVNTGKEEPENIAVYYELLKLKYNKAQIKVLDNRVALKDKWGFNGREGIKFNELASDFDVVAKLLPWHDKALYHGNTIFGYQDMSQNNDLVFNLLRNVDMVVGLDEGTTEAFAFGHDVPVITVKGFKYRQHKHDGRKYELMDVYETKASTHVELSDLKDAIEYGLAHPEYKKEERKEIAETELGISYGNATQNILSYVKSETKNLSPVY